MRRIVAEVAQHTETDALVRDRPQLLLDLLDRGAHAIGRGQPHGEQAGEPADRAGQIDAFEQLFAAMAFELDQGLGVAGPATDHPRQGGQQQVVDLGAIRRGSLLQQLLSEGFVETAVQHFGVTALPAALGVIPRQIHSRALQLLLPERQFGLNVFSAGVGLQMFAPGLVGAGLGRQLDGGAGAGLLISPLQIFQQDAPRHTVHGQVVHGQ
ncbi:hypothetical protein D3C84_733740 [compost metagenome]